MRTFLFLILALLFISNISTADVLNPNPPAQTARLVFIHHSTGYGWLSIGNLNEELNNNKYYVTETDYGWGTDIIGDRTDIGNWYDWFLGPNRDTYTQELYSNAWGRENTIEDPGGSNSIIMFKSCFPNSWIESEGKDQGDPDSTKQTTANYKAVYNALREYFQKQPGTLFVVVSAPPLVKPEPNKVKESIRGILGREDTVEKAGRRVRSFNNWLKDVENGWLKGYPLKNIVVFDYYDVLTGHGQSDWSLYPTGGGANSHPSSDGNTIAAKEFTPFLNRTVHRMGW